MTFEEYISELKKVIREALDVIQDGFLIIKEAVDNMEEGEKGMTKEEAIKVIDDRFEIMGYCESAKLEEALDLAIESLKQPEPRKKGTYTESGENEEWYCWYATCNECGSEWMGSRNFCPNCGADMIGEQDAD